MPSMIKTQSQNSLNDVMSINTNSNLNDITSIDRTTSQVCNMIRFFSLYYMSIKMFPSYSYVQNPFEFNVRYIEKKEIAAIIVCSLCMYMDKFISCY